MVRLFIALLPPAELHGLLAPVLGGVSGARWQTAEQLHITLRFVGAISGRQINGLPTGSRRSIQRFRLSV